jgi:two-component system cell cycle sensor histidine kinase/response regulator CckA
MEIDLGDLSVAQLVHDLRTHVIVAIACADALADVVPEGAARRQLAELRRWAERASELARNLLTAARALSDRTALDLNRVLAPVAEALSLALGDRIRTRINLSIDPLLVVAERPELERILVNLVLNARDAIPRHGVVTIETGLMPGSVAGRLEGMPPGPYARLIVSDTGSGLTPDLKRRLFEPFFTTRKTGTGLGLSSVAFTVGQLDGTISVDSEHGRGTSVSVILPLAPGHRR